jgi:hypothetical protein
MSADDRVWQDFCLNKARWHTKPRLARTVVRRHDTGIQPAVCTRNQLRMLSMLALGRRPHRALAGFFEPTGGSGLGRGSIAPGVRRCPFPVALQAAYCRIFTFKVTYQAYFEEALQSRNFLMQRFFLEQDVNLNAST